MKGLGIAFSLITIFVACAVTTSSAFAAVEGELLLENKKIGAEILVESAGELLFEDMGAPGEPAILCPIIYHGTTSEGKLITINEILMLNGEALDETGKMATPGVRVECEAEKFCTGTPTIVALNLGWDFEIELMTTLAGENIYLGVFKIETGKEPAFAVDCVSPLIGLVEDTCKGVTSARLTNDLPKGLLTFFNSLLLVETTGAESEELNCSVGGLKGLIQTDVENAEVGGPITSPSGELTVSG